MRFGAAAILAVVTVALLGCDGSAIGDQPARAAPSGSAMASGNGAAPRPASTPPTSAPRGVDWTTGGCPMPSDTPRGPIGKSTDQLVRDYGPTATDVRFTLGEVYDPVRMTVRNVLSAPADLRREVREQAWEHTGCELRVWSTLRNGAWVAVHSMRSEAGGEH